MTYEREQHDGQVMSHYWIGNGVRAIASHRAATPTGLSRFASSCQHRIAIARGGQ
jgi:hypothetical protein